MLISRNGYIASRMGFLRRRASSDSPRREPLFGTPRPFSPRRTTVSNNGYYKICFVNGNVWATMLPWRFRLQHLLCHWLLHCLDCLDKNGFDGSVSHHVALTNQIAYLLSHWLLHCLDSLEKFGFDRSVSHTQCYPDNPDCVFALSMAMSKPLSCSDDSDYIVIGWLL